jgi:hypothetical protein
MQGQQLLGLMLKLPALAQLLKLAAVPPLLQQYMLLLFSLMALVLQQAPAHNLVLQPSAAP